MSEREKTIAEIREALEKATPGPWTKFENRIYGKAQPAVEPIICEFYEEETERDRNNARLIANAPEWLGFLLEERDKLIEGLRWYADGIKYMNWPSELWINQGQRARDILKEIGVTVE